MNRVVTGYDEHGNPAIVRQGEPPTVIHAGRYVTTELWVTDATPRLTGTDPSTREWALEPPPGGSCFRIVEIAPEGQVEIAPDSQVEIAPDGQQDDGGSNAADGGALDGGHDGFQEAHATGTLDYVTVLRGQVTLVVGSAEVTLGPGDSVVQQPGVPHDWQNRSAERAVMVGVLLSASG
jgi:mannose-6-phosphate isomerase-like protein (cupin superfamily)